MAIRITLAVVGLFVGFGIIGLAWNDNLGKAYDVITGSSSVSSDSSTQGNNPPGPSFTPPFQFPPIRIPWGIA